ncbi:beta-ribofuranosylaminobenzene 5'-phosphate synthase family protein [Mesorhizobium sp. L2C085B000]|uniref:beta-ribofuranosylaminobenzene 5'-phosphate synthase family protein n=1 Tax=Mesorhizobium sp. L2C085B000 TaxID=1287117 RepID=UPI0018CAE442|nr:beta-ribofuranosylaminobenzene 5'-phosphate synthase family protein [Mesorhizobium sp. L2C085B000]
MAENTTITLKQFGTPVARMCEVRVDARPRLHLGLLSLHEGAFRKNGGIGFAIEGPVAEIEICESSRLVIRDDRPLPMATSEQDILGEILEQFALDHGMARRGAIHISGGMRTHVGMGSATAIRLGAMEALALLNQTHISTERLIAASGRGGTSGIGINTYFNGGLVCDLGRPSDGGPYMPSSRTMPTRLPLALPIVQMPPWPILLCVPRSIVPKTQQEEIAFFERTTPLPATASFEAAYIALFEIYAAVAERNYHAFCRGVTLMQETAWKRAERAEYGKTLHVLSMKLLDAGADCVGMSSLGPMLFCFADPSRITAIAERAEALGCDVYRTSPANAGRSVAKADA